MEQTVRLQQECQLPLQETPDKAHRQTTARQLPLRRARRSGEGAGRAQEHSEHGGEGAVPALSFTMSASFVALGKEVSPSPCDMGLMKVRTSEGCCGG